METLLNTVIQNGFCIGCGICSSVSNSGYRIKMNKYGMYEAELNSNIEKEVEEKLLNICPFTSKVDETQMAKENFEVDGVNFQEHLGFYQSLYVGHVSDEIARLQSSSGGLVTKLIEELFNKKEIDGIIHVKSKAGGNELFNYDISYSNKELNSGKKSRYYPITLDEILKKIKDDNQTYAIIGLPCFIKGVRLLLREEKGFNIKYFIGIICGQLKSKYFINIFTQPYGFQSKDIINIDFRVKLENKHANQYAVSFKTRVDQKEIITKSANKIFGSDWGLGTLKYLACDVCDDVFNETADIVFGDAWVQPYNKDWKGTNIVIARNSKFDYFINEMKNREEIVVNELSENDALITQYPNIRHRRLNIGYRLSKLNKTKKWVPTKRFVPSVSINRQDRIMQDLRIKFTNKSHKAMYLSKKYNSKWIFYFMMLPIALRYGYIKNGFKYFIPSFIKIFVKKIIY